VRQANLSRRRFLRDGYLLGGGLWLAVRLPLPRAARAAVESDRPEVLTVAEWKTLEALTARIVPSDHEPGAREAGCTNFIDKALVHEEARSQPLYQAGLRGVEAVAKALFQRSFTELDASDQDELLAALENGSAAGWPSEAGASPLFFETVRVHTIVGFLSDPRYGGNRDFAGWRVAGYPGPRHRVGGYTPEQVTGDSKVRTVWGSEQ
jgi:gluconate 2-dehydrogenase gamma chain